jgi:hypothetical protein
MKVLDFDIHLKSLQMYNSQLDLTDKSLQRKINLCENVLAIYDKVDPGRTNNRTNVLFELNCARIIECQLKFDKNLIKQSDALARDEKVFRYYFNLNCFYVCPQATIDQCCAEIKECYEILVRETENKGIMDKRLERIMSKSFVA